MGLGRLQKTRQYYFQSKYSSIFYLTWILSLFCFVDSWGKDLKCRGQHGVDPREQPRESP